MTCLKRIPLLRATLALAALAVAAPAYAAPYQFATFDITNANQPFQFTNNGGTSASFSASANVNFDFTTQTGLSSLNPIAGVLKITGTTTTPATGSTVLNQEFTTSTLSIIGAAGTAEAGKNLLTMTFTGSIQGIAGGASGNLLGSDTTGQTVTYSSDFATSINGPGNSYDLGLNTITPSLSIGPGGFLNTFIANLDGQFTGNFVPLSAVPAPTSVVMFGCGLAATGLLATQRKKLSRLSRS